MAKQSIFGRISTLMKANINAMLDSAEDPQKMLDQIVRDFTNSIADAESAIAETIGNLRLLERELVRPDGDDRVGKELASSLCLDRHAVGSAVRHLRGRAEAQFAPLRRDLAQRGLGQQRGEIRGRHEEVAAGA